MPSSIIQYYSLIYRGVIFPLPTLKPFPMKRVKIEMEFIFRASPAIVYKFLTSPDCLIRWFCDEADITGDVYTYTWSGADEVAILIDDIEEERLKFKWEDADNAEEYLEFRMSKSPVTNTSILEITDFCDDDEIEDTKALWESQMKVLQGVTGG